MEKAGEKRATARPIEREREKNLEKVRFERRKQTLHSLLAYLTVAGENVGREPDHRVVVARGAVVAPHTLHYLI